MSKDTPKIPVDKPATDSVASTQEVAIPPRTRSDLLNLRRQLRGCLEYIEQTLRSQGVKV